MVILYLRKVEFFKDDCWIGEGGGEGGGAVLIARFFRSAKPVR